MSNVFYPLGRGEEMSEGEYQAQSDMCSEDPSHSLDEDPGYWCVRSGATIEIREMAIEHLENSIKLFTMAGWGEHSKILELKEELSRRSKLELEQINELLEMHPGSKLNNQQGGNVVVYSAQGDAIWASNSAGLRKLLAEQGNLRHEEPETDVSHASLERTGDSVYRSVSPCCGSFLLVRRVAEENLLLSRHDACVLCGKRYRYIDESINGEAFAEELP